MVFPLLLFRLYQSVFPQVRDILLEVTLFFVEHPLVEGEQHTACFSGINHSV